jgi:hypothetical protein
MVWGTGKHFLTYVLHLHFNKNYSKEFNIVTEFILPMKLPRPINMCPNVSCSNTLLAMYLSDAFLIQNVLKQVDDLSHFFPLFFRICYSEGPGKWGIEIGGGQQFLVCAVGDKLLGENTNAVKRNTESPVYSGVEVNTEKSIYIYIYIYMSMSRLQNDIQNRTITEENELFENVAQFK